MAPFETDAFTAADVGSYGLYQGNSKEDWRICSEITGIAHSRIVTGKLSGYEPMRMVAIDGVTYPYPYLDFVARGAEKVVFEDDVKIGDPVHAIIDDLGFCYAVWK